MPDTSNAEKLVERIARIIDPDAFDVWDESWHIAPGNITLDAMMTINARETARTKARTILLDLRNIIRHPD